MVFYSGFRSLRTIWPVALIAGIFFFALTQFAVSNFIGPELPDVLASLVSLICVITFVQFWQPRDIDTYRANIALEVPDVAIASAVIVEAEQNPSRTTGRPNARETILAWLPWAIVSLTVIAWTFLKIPAIGTQMIKWPDLNNQVFLTLYNKPYAAIYNFQPLGTGTAILLAMIFPLSSPSQLVPSQ